MVKCLQKFLRNNFSAVSACVRYVNNWITKQQEILTMCSDDDRDAFLSVRAIRSVAIHKPHVSYVWLLKLVNAAVMSPSIVELHAILLALDVVRRSKEKHFLLLSDSYWSLIALGGSHVDQDTIYKYLKTYSTLTNSGNSHTLLDPRSRGDPWKRESWQGSKSCPVTSYISCQGISHGLPPTRQTTYAQRMARNMELLWW